MKRVKVSKGKKKKNALGFMNVMEVTFINPSALFGSSKICRHLINARNVERMELR